MLMEQRVYNLLFRWFVGLNMIHNAKIVQPAGRPTDLQVDLP
jgi:hypothetical protein